MAAWYRFAEIGVVDQNPTERPSAAISALTWAWADSGFSVDDLMWHPDGSGLLNEVVGMADGLPPLLRAADEPGPAVATTGARNFSKGEARHHDDGQAKCSLLVLPQR